MKAAQDRHREHANRKRRPILLTPGSLVLLSSKHLKYAAGLARKLLPRYVGPYNVIRVINKGSDTPDSTVQTVAVAPQLPANWRIRNVFHVSLIKPFVPADMVAPPPPVVFTGENDPLYEIESIDAHRKSGSRMDYWVRWKNASNILTWEPEEKLTEFHPHLVDQYWHARDDRPVPPVVQVPLPPPSPRRSERVAARQQ